jgi:hypothetical protein
MRFRLVPVALTVAAVYLLLSVASWLDAWSRRRS